MSIAGRTFGAGTLLLAVTLLGCANSGGQSTAPASKTAAPKTTSNGNGIAARSMNNGSYVQNRGKSMAKPAASSTVAPGHGYFAHSGQYVHDRGISIVKPPAKAKPAAASAVSAPASAVAEPVKSTVSNAANIAKKAISKVVAPVGVAKPAN